MVSAGGSQLAATARRATGSWRAARKGFHFPAGRPRPTGLPRPPRHGYQNACAPGTRESPLATGPPILGAPHFPGTFLGVLEVLFVLAKAPVPRSGLAPTPATSPRLPNWPLATLATGNTYTLATFRPYHAPPRWRRSQPLANDKGRGLRRAPRLALADLWPCLGLSSEAPPSPRASPS